MPDSTLRSLSDQALATSAAHTLVASAGPGAVPTCDPNLTWDGTTLAALHFSGNGAALTNLSPAAITAGTAGISVSGNAGTVTNGVYTTGSYADPAWLTGLGASKLSGVPSAILKGAAGAVASAVAGTDYQTPTGDGSANTATGGRTGEVARTHAARLTDVFNVKDFGAKGDGVADDTAAILAAVAAAKAWLAGGSQGATVWFPPGNYILSQPIVLPRTDEAPSGGVHLVGSGMLQSRITGSSTFPANRAMIEWEQVAKAALFQRISDLYLYQSDSVNCRAIHYQITIPASDPASNSTNMAAERLTILLENLLIGSNNSVHAESIYLEGDVADSVIRNVYGNPWVGLGFPASNQYDTLLLRSDTQISGSQDVHGLDPPGLSKCLVENLLGETWAGGYSTIFSGRITRTRFSGSFNQGGVRGPGWEFINSDASTLENLANEGNGGSSLLRLKNCQNLIVQNFETTGPANEYIATWTASKTVSVGDFIVPTVDQVAAHNVSFRCTTAGTTGASQPTWPSSGTVTDGTAVWTVFEKAYPDGIELINTTDCHFQGKNGFTGNQSFSQFGAHLITGDSTSLRNTFSHFGIPAGGSILSNEIALTDTSTNRLEWFDPATTTPQVFGAAPPPGNIVAPSANYTIQPGDTVVLPYTQAGAIVLTLPLIASVADGQPIYIKNMGTSGNAVTFTLSGTDTFELGAASPSVAASGGWRVLVASKAYGTSGQWLFFGNG